MHRPLISIVLWAPTAGQIVLIAPRSVLSSDTGNDLTVPSWALLDLFGDAP
ncbi:hypothetical protein E9232_005523 [Inquilinus ginsengisoli]|jgi:hypothetical protein|uniref:Uncharacterized protein n=1 Tax=Inquilinus ginsengisoli TaxID=363840 RepID=A0ABU1JWH9_9PROT|nr:hypothetical protein [Inquilinus ginsengisoli]